MCVDVCKFVGTCVCVCLSVSTQWVVHYASECKFSIMHAVHFRTTHTAIIIWKEHFTLNRFFLSSYGSFDVKLHGKLKVM